MPAVGGVARRATLIGNERRQNPHVLVLDAGDSLAGDQEPALRTAGATSITAMNRLGYDAMTLGGRDLALGSAALKRRIADAKFAILSANAVYAATGQLVAQPYVVREVGGLRVAVVGLTEAGDVREFAVRDPLTTAQKIVLEAAGQADVVIVLSHAGADVDQQIADSVPGIAAVVSGGPGALADAWRSAKTGTLRLHADQGSPGHAGRLIGIGRLTFDRQRKLADYTWRVQPLDPTVPDDAAMTAWVKQQLAR